MEDKIKKDQQISKTERIAKEVEEKEKEEQKKDFETWFPPLEFIETIKGERIAIPPISAGKEAKVFQALARLLDKLPKKMNLANLDAADLLNIAPKLLKEAPEEGFFIAATLLDKEPQWIRDNLDFDRIFSLILPFVGREAKLFSKVGGLFEKLSP